MAARKAVWLSGPLSESVRRHHAFTCTVAVQLQAGTCICVCPLHFTVHVHAAFKPFTAIIFMPFLLCTSALVARMPCLPAVFLYCCCIAEWQL